MESSLRSGNFLAFSAFTKQATTSNNSYNSHNNSNGSGNKGNNGSDVSYYKKPTVACINSPTEPVLVASQLARLTSAYICT